MSNQSLSQKQNNQTQMLSTAAILRKHGEKCRFLNSRLMRKGSHRLRFFTHMTQEPNLQDSVYISCPLSYSCPYGSVSMSNVQSRGHQKSRVFLGAPLNSPPIGYPPQAPSQWAMLEAPPHEARLDEQTRCKISSGHLGGKGPSDLKRAQERVKKTGLKSFLFFNIKRDWRKGVKRLLLKNPHGRILLDLTCIISIAPGTGRSGMLASRPWTFVLFTHLGAHQMRDFPFPEMEKHFPSRFHMRRGFIWTLFGR